MGLQGRMKYWREKCNLPVAKRKDIEQRGIFIEWYKNDRQNKDKQEHEITLKF